MTLKEEYQASLKSMDTEEWLDLHFYRPMGFAWAKLFAKTGVTPNAVTIFSIFLGVFGGILLFPNEIWPNLLGIFLIIWANTYDSADGQLARMTKQYSRMGRILDGVSGDFWFLAIYLAIVFRELYFGDRCFHPFEGSHAWIIWTMAIVAGLCHAKQAAMADYYRQFHLYFLKGKEGSELDSTAQLKVQYDNMSWGRDGWNKLVLFFYRGYTRNQERYTPNMQRLRAALHERYGDEVPPQEFRDSFRKKSLPLMKYTNILSFNTRIIAMFISVLINIPWLYFAFELVVLNALLVYMIVRHESKCKAALKEVK